MEVSSRKVVFSSTGRERRFNAFPALLALRDGTLLVTFQSAVEKNGENATIRLMRSVDGGGSWQEGVEPFREWAEQRNYSIHVCYLSELPDGRIMASLMVCDRTGAAGRPFFNPETGGALPIFVALSVSLDAGRTWDEPRRLPTRRFDEFPTPVMGPVVVDGQRLLLPFEVSKCFDDASPWRHYAAALVSSDGGRTWPETVVTAHDDSDRLLYWDNKIIALGDGKLLVVCWTFDTATNKDVDVHVARSFDSGKSWSAPVPTGIRGQMTFPIRLADDRIASASVDRFGDHAIKLYTGGFATDKWKCEGAIYTHDIAEKSRNGLNAELAEMQFWSFGLPSLALLPDGGLVAVWYAGDTASAGIETARITL